MNALLSVAIFFAQHAIYGPWVRECNALWTWEMMISHLLLFSFIRLSFSVLQKLEKKGNNLLHSNHFAICTLQRAKNEATSSIFCEPRADLVIALQVCDLVPNVSGRMRAWEPTFIPQMSLPVYPWISQPREKRLWSSKKAWLWTRIVFSLVSRRTAFFTASRIACIFKTS